MNKAELKTEVARILAGIKKASIAEVMTATTNAEEAILAAVESLEVGFIPEPGRRSTAANIIDGPSYGEFKIQQPRAIHQMAWMLGYGNNSYERGKCNALLSSRTSGRLMFAVKRHAHTYEHPQSNSTKWMYELCRIQSNLGVYQSATSILVKMGIMQSSRSYKYIHRSRFDDPRVAASYILNRWVEAGWAEYDGDGLYRLVKN